MHRLIPFALALIAVPLVAVAGPLFSTSQGTFASAQNVNSGFTLGANPNVQDATTISHVEIQQLGKPTSGHDFYTFTHFGGTVHLDIDSAPTATSFDTEIAIWNDAGTLLFQNDDAGGDTGDGGGAVGGFFNSSLFNLNLAADTYVVGVGYVFGGTSFQSGDPYVTGTGIDSGSTYTLNISANVTPPTAVPEPGTLALLGSCVVSLGAMGWRPFRRRSS